MRQQDAAIPSRKSLTSSPSLAETTIKMKHLAAYLLLTLGGNEKPSADDVKKVLDSVGIEADSDRLSKLLSELEGKDINEVRTPQAPGPYVGNPTQGNNADGQFYTAHL